GGPGGVGDRRAGRPRSCPAPPSYALARRRRAFMHPPSIRSAAAAMTLPLVVAGVGPSAVAAPPPIRHVFVIVLENKSFDATFGPGSTAPYLSQTLTQQGQLLRQYYAIGHASLDNYIA